jgi:CheY-like chemotaxis protein
VTSILIVEDDERLRSAVARDLSHRGFDVTSVVSVDDALSCLRERVYDVLLTDLRMGERDGIDLLGRLPDIAPRTPAILMSAFATARDHQRAIELGAVQVLCKPFTSLDLAHAIRQAVECESGFRGNLHGISLVDVLQMFHFARRSVCVTVGGRDGGDIHVHEGEIVHAASGELAGEAALKRILGMHSGSIRSGPLVTEQRTIDRPFELLLLDVLRVLDEAKRASNGDPEPATPDTAAGEAANASPLCSALVHRVEGAVRCGAVDLETRALLGSHPALGDDGEMLDALVADAMDLLCATSLAVVDGLIGPARAPSDDAEVPSYREARLLLGDVWRLMVTAAGGRKAIVLDTRRDTSPGLALWHLRSSITALEREA